MIVGGGTAGLVLVNRLSEDNTVQVLAALNNKTIRLPLGRALGGSSAINGQVFLATSKVSIDTWGELGNPGWTWDVLAQYCRKSFTLDRPAPDSLVHKHYTDSRSGPLATGGVVSYALLGLQDCLPSHLLPDGFNFTNEHPLQSAHSEYVTRLLCNPAEATATFCGQASQGNFGALAGALLLQSGLLPGNYFTIAAYILQPMSRGSVHIRSSDIFEAVKLDPGYLRHPLDLEVLARHMAYVPEIVSKEPLASLLNPGGRRNASAPTDNNLESMKEYVKKTTLSSWHPTSTCSMLPAQPGSVVNERLVVYGSQNLRVVDASIFPITTRANPMATVYAVAERAADIIKEDFITS
ncbi:GMC oxidoreductase-domain-containing protein [Xylaria palmicola]|nr:GMC oxidoreductase-domain-containing protein [Xylaria palmicola]